MAYKAKLGLPIYGGDATNDPTLAINLKDLPSALDSFVAIAPNPGSKAFR
jgi:hypothetical protein